MKADNVKRALARLADKNKARILARFFKTGKGHYGEGDKFLGISVPAQRQVAKKFSGLSLAEIDKLLKSPYHEHRLTAVLILVDKFQTATTAEQAIIVEFYLAKIKFINNWDLVDLSAPKILGEWLVKRDKRILNKLTSSANLWPRRIAILATFAFIKRGELKPTWDLAKKLLSDRHDLMHKASGWMLREAGKRDLKSLKKFLNEHKHKMPRTMLRYAIEKFNKKERQKYLKKI